MHGSTTARLHLGRSVPVGLGLGLTWGAVAHAWMRQLGVEPQLSWRGTVAVVVSAGVSGALLGVIHGAARQRRSQSWRALALPGVALFLGPGLPFLPAFVLGGWGMRRGVVGRSVALGATAAAPLLLVMTLTQGETEGLFVPTDLLGLVAAVGGAALLAVTSTWAGSVAFGPWRGRVGTTPGLRVAPQGPPRVASAIAASRLGQAA